VTTTDELSNDELCNDELWMEEALRASQRALEAGEVPVGAVGRVRWPHRRPRMESQHRRPRSHRFMPRSWPCATRGAATGNHRLVDCDLFVTIEPCAMCAGAMVHARIKRLIYGADDPKAGAIQSVMQVLHHSQLNHRVEVTGGVLAGRCAELLQTFFQNRRFQNRR